MAGNFLLSERDPQLLVAPLGLSGRIKYTCVALSSRYIALGANTGGVYCFHRDHTYIQLLANKEGSVSIVRFSPDELFLAVVAGGGTVVIWELRLTDGGVCKRLHVSGLLKEALIRDVVWEGRRGRVFFGDNRGRVAVASLPKATMKSNLFRKSNDIIFQDRTAVVQLDLHGDMLLVSTHTRVVLLILSSTSKSGVQIGKKSRDGPFGACFDVRQHSDQGQVVVYSARPGGRLWEATVEGAVQSTVKMRELFISPPSPILGHGCNPTFPPSPLTTPPPTLPLHYLHSSHNGSQLVSWDDTGLYIWQPSSWQLSAWTMDLPGIVGVACDVWRGEGGGDGITVCAIVEGGRKVFIVTMATLASCIQCLLKEQLLDQVTKLVCAHVKETIVLLHSHTPLSTSLLTIFPPSREALLPPSPTSQGALQELKSHLEQLAALSRPEAASNQQYNIPGRSHDGPGGGSHDGPGGWSHDGPGGRSHNGLGGRSHNVPGGQSHEGPGGRLHDRPGGLSHQKSKSWSGGVEDTVEDIFNVDEEGEEEEEGVSYTPSLSLEVSQSSLDTPSLESSTEATPTSSEDSQWQQSDSLSVGVEASPSHTSQVEESKEQCLEVESSPLLSHISETEATRSWLGGQKTESGVGEEVEIKPEVAGEEIKPEVAGEEIKPEVAGEEIKPEVVAGEEIKPEVAGEEIKPEVAGEEIKPEVGREEIKPEVAGEEIKPEVGREEINKLMMEGEVEEEMERQILSSQSLQQSAPPHIAMATLLDHNSDDVIAVPVRSEAGARSRSKRRSRRSSKKNSLSSFPSLPSLHSLPSLPSPPTIGNSCDTVRETAVGRSVITEEDDVLPFPDAGLPSDVMTDSVPDSAHTQRGPGIMSKMKSLAKQGGQNLGLESETLQVLQQPVKKVKELLSSLATPIPTALSISEAQTIFMNEEYIVPQPLPVDDITRSVNQSDCDVGSHDTPDGPLEDQKSTFADITMATKRALAQPHVYCYSHNIRSTITNWLVVMETTMASDSGDIQSVEEGTLIDLLTLALEVGVYGSEGGLVPFLSHYSSLLHGVRTMTVLGLQEWSVRSEGWRVLVGRGQLKKGGKPSEVIKEMTNQKARAPDLPTYLKCLVNSDPLSLVATCVESWPAVLPWQVALVCCTDQSGHSTESHDQRPLVEVYISYLTRLLGDCEGVRRDVGCDEEMVLASLEILLEAGPPTELLATASGQPKSWSHKHCWPHATLLATMVDMCVAMTTHHLTCATRLCERCGYWLGVVQLAVAGGNRRKALLTILALQDATLLQDSEKWGSLLTTVAEWKEVLQIVKDLPTDDGDHKGDDQDNKLTLCRLVRMLVASVGPSLATHIMASVGGAGGGATGEEGAELHSLMIQLSAIHAQQKTLARSVLEKIDRYLWSRQPSSLSPWLQVLEERERRGQMSGSAPDQTDMEWRQTLEDSGRHWGVRVGGEGQCGVCLSPLCVTGSTQQLGLLLFPCGHAYHRHCAPELACYLCFKRNLTNHSSVTSNAAHKPLSS